MIYTVECALTEQQSDETWMSWVDDMKPPRIILSVPGVTTAQRLKGTNVVPEAYFAMYSVATPESLASQIYRDVGGGRLGTRPDRWNNMIKFWNRDLFDGAAVAPEVPLESRLLVIDRAEPGERFAGIAFQWLRAVGLDKSTPFRGLAVVSAAEAEGPAVAAIAGVRIFRPIMEQARSASTDSPIGASAAAE